MMQADNDPPQEYEEMRCCLRDLGMTFTEWRQWLRILRALSLAGKGREVEAVAQKPGYANASSLIALFGKLMQRIPAEFVKSKDEKARGT